MTKVIYRKDKVTKEVIAFLPEVDVRWGNIMCYTHNEQHNEADILWYQRNTSKATQEEYADLHRELNQRYDNQLVINQRLQRKDLFWVK